MKETIAQEAYESLSGDIDRLKEEYDNATEAREHWVTEIKEKADIDVDNYDPRDGPPELPEEPQDDSTDDTGDGTDDEQPAAQPPQWDATLSESMNGAWTPL